jgi:hypothetical protein
MNLIDPKYIKDILDIKFPEFKAEIRDYSKIKGLEYRYESWGICVLGFYSEFNIAINIEYLPSNKVNFKIEVEQNTIMYSTWDNNDIDESVYEFYIYIIEKIISNRRELDENIRRFGSKHWINRNKQLSNFNNYQFFYGKKK